MNTVPLPCTSGAHAQRESLPFPPFAPPPIAAEVPGRLVDVEVGDVGLKELVGAHNLATCARGAQQGWQRSQDKQQDLAQVCPSMNQSGGCSFPNVLLSDAFYVTFTSRPFCPGTYIAVV
eukprot:819454-Pelagomonas_calceolata.AAC.5